MRTHVLEEGSGPPVVLLHSGEYGACAESSWSHLVPELAAAGYHVVAPDWLGFGLSDKVVDFADPAGRRMRHMAATIAALDLGPAAVVGNSMGGTYLAMDIAAAEPTLGAVAAVLVSGGGFVPDNDARHAILDYDLTEEGMARILRVLMHASRHAEDPRYVAWRHRLSLEPGAWQCAASARLRPPTSTRGGEFGRADTTPYENIKVPTLIVAGADDPLRLPGYADEVAARVPDVELLVYPECGHVPNIEHPDRFRDDLLSFLDRRYRYERDR
ncbi:MAG: alpha/beta hydrolase [Pseudonocardia sp.]|uniref:alpha/beta fold hydrolase n=1 Tax=unclassified Pseudonocardia TaxID=2619320 RepID=UPI000869B17F|nr:MULTISPECIES: alpha/beta hydrolase [unclassified Pseudonocardia]MBN9107912.1 alpha/beta hydrolase [Pseudonocardia sp.]ODU25890.1 MAG: alpha/beta hydrolase [Pseudonocardia sp. SCN 72-51]ODV07569.1 MAG: alpha/beta hydrolase [Pseudonocardia sp. SCN 73-27]